MKRVLPLLCPSLFAACMEQEAVAHRDLHADVAFEQDNPVPLPTGADFYEGPVTVLMYSDPAAYPALLEEGTEIAGGELIEDQHRSLTPVDTFNVTPGAHTFTFTAPPADDSTNPMEDEEIATLCVAKPEAEAWLADSASVVETDTTQTGVVCRFNAEGELVAEQAPLSLTALQDATVDGLTFTATGPSPVLSVDCGLFTSDGTPWLVATPTLELDADYPATVTATFPAEARVLGTEIATFPVAYAGAAPVPLALTVNGVALEPVSVYGGTTYSLPLAGFAADVGAGGVITVAAQATTPGGLVSDVVEGEVPVVGMYGPGTGIRPSNASAYAAADCDFGLGEGDLDPYTEIILPVRADGTPQSGVFLFIGSAGRESLTLNVDSTGMLVFSVVAPSMGGPIQPFSVQTLAPHDGALHIIDARVDPDGISLGVDGAVAAELPVANLTLTGLAGADAELLAGVGWHFGALAVVRGAAIPDRGEVSPDPCADLDGRDDAFCFAFDGIAVGSVATGSDLGSATVGNTTCTLTSDGPYTSELTDQ